jgi:hypothetical protein
VGVVAAVKWEVVKIKWDRSGGSRAGVPVRVSGPYISSEAERIARGLAKSFAEKTGGEYYARPIVELPVLPPNPPPIDDRTWELGA